MKLRKSLNLMVSLCLMTTLGGVTSLATAAEVKAPAATAGTTQTVTLLNGKLVFNLTGYEVQPVPGGGPGKMYVSKQEKRVLLIGEDDIPLVARAGSDADFLEGMKAIKDKQKQASPSYTVTSEKIENVKGLEVDHIEASDKMDGNDVLQATLLAAGEKKFTVIQVISGAKDKAGHAAAVNNILGK